jgi:hypothetical protein
MTAFQVRCYSNGAPGKELQTAEAATALEAAEKICGGPLTAIHRQQVHWRDLNSYSHRAPQPVGTHDIASRRPSPWPRIDLLAFLHRSYSLLSFSV